MRIIAGSLGGRQFNSPHGNRTHPMSDKVRGALFNTLGDISGLSVLDAFAGSGALAYEALSRGADRVVAIDNDKNAQRAIADNIRQLNLGEYVKLIKAAANSWLQTTADSFDLVFLDPPYDHVKIELLTRLADRAKVGGIVVVSLPPDASFELIDNYTVLQTKDHGDATLVFYRKTG